MTRLESNPDDSTSNSRGESSQPANAGVRLCVGKCPICGDGLCTVRSYFDDHHELSYGLVVCDECEAIWLQPDTGGPHVFPDAESPHSPIGGGSLYDPRHSRWATRDDVDALGWSDEIDPELTHGTSSSESASDPFSDPRTMEVCDELLDLMLAHDVDPVQAGLALKKLVDDDDLSGDRLIAMMAAASDRIPDADPAVLGGLLRLIHIRVLHAQAARDDQQMSALPVASLVKIIQSLSPQVANRHLLLQLLAMMRTPESLAALLQALVDSPPRGWMAAGQILSPLMQHDDWPIDSLYPGLLDCLGEPSLAAPILDLAGHLVRSGRVGANEHPAKNRIAALNALLSQVADRLGKFEEDPQSFGTDVEQVQAILGEAVALAVSLCDAVALIGDESSIAPLNKAAQLRHRRVQCEAAGALARFGDAAGIEQLISLAAEPSARLRAIAYADELGIGERIDESLRTPEATAQAEVALWLSQPLQMGVPPTSVEVVDVRRLLWPSFHDPVDVFLVRYQYDFGDRSYSNVALAGPTVFSLSADVADLPPEDIYAIYAGWHAEHEDIFTVPASEFNEAQRRLVEPLQTYLVRHDYEDIEPALLGFFLEETAAVFTASRGGVACVVVTDGLETMDLPTAGRLRPATPMDLFHLYKGRKMLRTFNPQGI